MISIILPVFNERENLPTIIYLLEEMSQNHSIPIEIVIVQDNSEDGTRHVSQKLATFYKNIKIHKRPKKMGLGSAYRDGLQQCSGEFILIMDADFSHHPKYIPLLVAKQQERDADLVTTTRYAEGGGVEGWTFYRKLTSRVANFIASWSLGSNFTDLTGSFRLYKKRVFQELIAETKTKGYSFQMEMLIRAWKMGKAIDEIPIVFVDRIYGKSKLEAGEVFTYLKGTLTLFLTY